MNDKTIGKIVGDTANRSVAIIGSGPGGMYVAQALLEKVPTCRIDIFDRLPTPFGLIRGGVAPDHQHTKRVDQKYADIFAKNENVRYLGNVELGRDVTIDDFNAIYDAVVLAYGAPFDNKLGIPGEDKKNVFGSNALVGWYNCHPDFLDLNPDLDINGVVVIGVGNVAIDVARVLSRTPEEMATTDIADYAISAIDASPLKEVWMIGRRGPIEAAFSNTELKELGALADATSVVDASVIPAEVPADFEEREKKARGRILDTLRALAEGKTGKKRRTIHIEFFGSPVEILGGETVEGIRIERTKVVDGRCIPTGETYDIPCQMVVTCIGSRAEAIANLPFNERSGIITHEDGKVSPGVYAAGWLKRGATGTIGTNRLDSFAVTDLLISEFGGPAKPGPDAFDHLVVERELKPVTFDDWLIIKELEEKAATDPAPRRKFATVEEMLDGLGVA
jgi:ferredoxin--NADP+ reductase